MSEYLVETTGYRGPLAVLLELIESNRYQINNLPIALITSQYQAYISQTNLSLQDLAGFIELGTRLLYLKSRALLPTPAADQPELARLNHDLLAYQLTKKHTQALKHMMSRGSFRRPYQRQRDAQLSRKPLAVEVGVMSKAYQHLMLRQPKLPGATQTQPLPLPVISQKLLSTLKSGPVTLPRTTTPPQWPLATVRTLNIMTLAAALELNRQTIVRVTQNEPFGPITLEENQYE